LLSLPELPLKHRSEDKTVRKKVNWSIEQHIYDRETEFLAELQKQGYIYQKTKYLNFRPEAAHQYFPPDDCVLFMGTLNLGRDILRTSWIPGAYMDEKNLRCSSYYTYLDQSLLNNKYFILSLGELLRRKTALTPRINSGGKFHRIHVFYFWVLSLRRNESGGLYPRCFRSFRAGVFNLNIFNTMQSLGTKLKRDETTWVLVSSKRAITKEWKFYVYKN
jgi:hypothetical protein